MRPASITCKTESDQGVKVKIFYSFVTQTCNYSLWLIMLLVVCHYKVLVWFSQNEQQKECPDIASEPKPCLNLTYQKVYKGDENRRSQTEILNSTQTIGS